MRTIKKLKRQWIKQCNQKILYCVLCGKLILKESEISAEHIIPKSKGGCNTVENLKPSHSLCNNLRGTMDIEEFKDILKNEYNNNVQEWRNEVHQRHLSKHK